MKQAEKRKYNNIPSDSGFTLVELIVVLAVIAIVSSAAVLSVIGYIDKARFDKNEQNAQSVFQAAQAAVNHKKANGELEDWINDVLTKTGEKDPYDSANSDKDSNGAALDDIYDDDDFKNFGTTVNKPGESVHMRYVLTYEKGGTDAGSKALEDLISSYFYDTTVMQATFTVEFDVEKTIGSDGLLHYNANVYAVFYDEGRAKWDKTAMKNPDDEVQVQVPYRDSGYRKGTSLVGYYNGGMPGAVDSVYVPSMDEKMEFAELSLRNGEALELSFSAVNDKILVTGSGLYKVHYTAEIYDQDTGKKLADLVISEAALTNGNPKKGSLADYSALGGIIKDTTKDGDISTAKIGGKDYPVLCTVEEIKDKSGENFTRYAASIETFALVYVHTGEGAFDYNNLKSGDLSADTDFYRFPLKISYIKNKTAAGMDTGYVLYSIALDSMMSREALYKVDENPSTRSKALNYSISRLFADTSGYDKTKAPKNLNVSMTVAADAFADDSLDDYNDDNNLPESDPTKAMRSVDDPVYLGANGVYDHQNLSSPDKDEAAGYAVVNSFFGDLEGGSLGSGSTAGSAPITAFRHLYNIRFMEGFAGDVEYSVKRDLDWYKFANEKYTSDVKVYGIVSNTAYLDYYSPVGKNAKYIGKNDLKLVMWPAIPKLPDSQKIVAGDNALSSDEDKTAVIRNVQMRRKSFLSTDKGLGFICENDGTIKNIRCENFMLNLDETADGAASDVGNADKAVKYLIGNGFLNRTGNPKALDNTQFGTVPVGGLIGLNKGVIGADGDPSAVGSNTVKMSNVNVFAGKWDGSKWTLYTGFKSIGGTVGEYASSASSYGTISTEGYYGVAGFENVGGIIGSAYAGVDAYLIADTTLNTDKAAVDFQNVDAFIMGRVVVGGAVGQMKDGYFAQNVTSPTYNCDDDEGIVNIVETDADKYGVYVNLSSGTYIRQAGSKEDSYGIGGAVGRIDNHTAGKVLSMKSVNAGCILSDHSDRARYVSGTVGFLNGGSASAVYINADNSGGIGTKDGQTVYDDSAKYDDKSYASAAGIAYISNFGNNDSKFVFNVKNSGFLYGGTNKETQKAAGVGIAVGALDTAASPVFVVKAVNSGKVYGADTTNDQFKDQFWKTGGTADYGVGGAIGFARSLGTSHIYVENAAGSVIEANGNNVGGAVGCIRNEAKGNTSDAFTITSVLQAGVSVKSSDGINVGGCVGNIWNQGDYCLLRTNVEGNVSISGYANVGGVAGRDQQAASAAGAYVGLKGASSAPTLTIRATNKNGGFGTENLNAGGVIGVVGYHGGLYTTSVSAPAQSVSDNLVMDLMAHSGVGGLAGSFYMSELEGATPQHGNCETEFTITLNPASVLTAIGGGGKEGQCVGGAFGLVTDNRDNNAYNNSEFPNGNSAARFMSSVTVTIPAGGNAAILQGDKYLGGVAGSFQAAGFDGVATVNISSPGAVTGKNRVGGAAGLFSVTDSARSIKVVLNAANAVTAENEAGGCIGLMRNTGTLGSVETVLGSESSVNTFSPICGNKDMGGCIGVMTENAKVTDAYATVNTTGSIIVRKTTAGDNIGGIVGKMTQNSVMTNAVLRGGDSAVLHIVMAENDADNKSGSVGGVAGCVELNSTIGKLTGSVPIDVRANHNVGGYVGTLDGGVIGTGDGHIELSNVIKVYALNKGAKNQYGTGGVIGYIKNSGTILGEVDITLVSGSIVRGYYNTGGLIGYVESGSATKNLRTHFKGGQVFTNHGGMGGVIGNIFSGDFYWLETYIESKYSTNDCEKSALAGNTDTSAENKGVGGVVGQIGTHTKVNDIAPRESVVNVDTMVLKFSEDFALLSGTSSVGGVLGQCETRRGHFNAITVKSIDHTVHDFVMKPGSAKAFDVGGLVGYMLSPITGKMSAEDVRITVQAQYYVGGWIGGLDGELGIKDKPDDFEVTGIKSVKGEYGVGGVIGGLGIFNDGGKIYDNIVADLRDAEITSTKIGGDRNKSAGSAAVGGVVGYIGLQQNKEAEGKESVIYGDITAKLSNTKISGPTGAGGVIGHIIAKNGRVDEDCKVTLLVEGDSSVSATDKSRYAGGVVGINENVFLGDIEYRMSGWSDYSISCQAGYAGGVVGKNAKVFGRTGDFTMKVPSGQGTVKINADKGYVGAVIGHNTSDGLCGVVKKSDDKYVASDAGTLTCSFEVDLNGTYDETTGFAGVMGRNEGQVSNIKMTGYERDPDPTPTPTEEPTATPTPTPTPTPTGEPTATPTPTPTPTTTTTGETSATPTPTEEPTATPTPTEEATATPTSTEEPTATPTPTEEPTATPTPTDAPTDSSETTEGT